MNVTDMISLVRDMRETALEDGVLVQLLYELEGRIALELHGEESYNAIDKLSLPLPWSRIYWTYLNAMIDLTEGNAARYALSDAVFRRAYDDYARYLQRTGARS